MRKTLLIISAILLLTTIATAQEITDYVFTATSGTFTLLTGATNPALSGGTLDDGWYNNIPIGFNFVFNNNTYTTVAATTNGCLFPGQTLTTSHLTNNLTSNTVRPIIAPLWDDLELSASTSFKYKTEGTAPNRVFTAEWYQVYWNYNATTPVISFQVKLYEGTNKIEFIYQQEAGAVVSGSASIGIAGIATGAGNFL
ncbi:MAG: hypothetical protein N2748_03290, partial [candidate division WOR-3 bacterium]|nr:hypothetical protein [candidate division WOR-3 bacterium]